MLSQNVGLWLEGLFSCEQIVQNAPNSPSVDLHAVVEPLSCFRGTPFFQTGASLHHWLFINGVLKLLSLLSTNFILKGDIEVYDLKRDRPLIFELIFLKVNSNVIGLQVSMANSLRMKEYNRF